jgi:hypothetical protein
VTNVFGCSDTAASLRVTVNPLPDARITPLGPTEFCRGDSVQLRAEPAGASYRWSNGDTLRHITVYDSDSLTVTVTDTNACSSTASPVIITVHPLPAILIASDGPLRFCSGGSVTLSAGEGFARYEWSTGETRSSIVVRESGRYWLRVTNEFNCEAWSDTLSVVVAPMPSVSINGPISVCSDATAIYDVPSRPGVSYRWSISGGGGSVIGDDSSSSLKVKWGTNGTGNVTLHALFDSSGCAFDTAVTVAVGEGLVPTVTASRSLSLCPGDSVVLDAGAYALYLWSDGSLARTIVVRKGGVYSVTVHDEAGCAGTSKPVTVTENPLPHPVINAPGGLRICQGDSTVLDAGGGYAKYFWSNGFRTRWLTARSAGAYNVTVVDSNGCVGASDPVNVTLEPPPVPAIVGPRLVCHNSTVGYSTPQITGGAYAWSVSGGTIVSGQGSSAVTVGWNGSGSGNVTVTIRSVGGCTGTSSFAVEIGDRLVPVIAVRGAATIC